jgi:biotin transport system substrate-specific component
MDKPLLLRAMPGLDGGILGRGAAVLVGTVILALAAHAQVPFWPVPMTLQTLAVFMIGATCGGRLAAATLVAYLAEGALGLPVFAGGAGPAYMVGPTGGYLLGFLAAATACGAMADRGAMRGPGRAVLAFLLAEVLIFTPGVIWLAGFTGLAKAVSAGLLPFLPGEALKIALAALAATGLSRRL